MRQLLSSLIISAFLVIQNSKAAIDGPSTKALLPPPCASAFPGELSPVALNAILSSHVSTLTPADIRAGMRQIFVTDILTDRIDQVEVQMQAAAKLWAQIYREEFRKLALLELEAATQAENKRYTAARDEFYRMKNSSFAEPLDVTQLRTMWEQEGAPAYVAQEFSRSNFVVAPKDYADLSLEGTVFLPNIPFIQKYQQVILQGVSAGRHHLSAAELRDLDKLELQKKSGALSDRDQGRYQKFQEKMKGLPHFFSSRNSADRVRAAIEIVTRHMSSEIYASLDRYRRSLNAEALTAILFSRDQWERQNSPARGAYDTQPLEQMLKIYREFLAEIEYKAFPKSKDFQQRVEALKSFALSFEDEPFEDLAEGGIRLNVTRKRVVADFVPSLGTILLKPAVPPKRPVRTAAVGEHGATTFSSNVGSYRDRLPFFGDLGLHITAVDGPGSMGDIGLAPNALTGFEEIAAYKDLLYSSVLLPFEDQSLFTAVLTQSSSSNDAFIHARMAHERRVHNLSPYYEPDLYWLTSFGNPYTAHEQIAAISEQAQSHDADIGVLIESSVKRYLQTADKTLAWLEAKRKTSTGWGDRVVFFQGEDDVDSATGERPVFEVMEDFIRKEAPQAHLVKFRSAFRGENQKYNHLLGPDSRVASHFLMVTRPNVTRATVDRRAAEERAAREISGSGKLGENEMMAQLPDSLLPAFSDQSFQFAAYCAGSEDYITGLSAWTTQQERARLGQKRLNLTGSNKPFAMLRTFVNEIKAAIKASHGIEIKSFDEIIADPSIVAGDQNLESRFKEVYEFWVARGENSHRVRAGVF